MRSSITTRVQSVIATCVCICHFTAVLAAASNIVGRALRRAGVGVISYGRESDADCRFPPFPGFVSLCYDFHTSCLNVQLLGFNDMGTNGSSLGYVPESQVLAASLKRSRENFKKRTTFLPCGFVSRSGSSSARRNYLGAA